MRVESCTTCPPPRQAAVAAGAVRSTALDVTVTTGDGDRVTLSASQTATIAGAAASDGRRAGASTTETRFSLGIEGTLDRSELRDLRKVLKLLAKAAADQDAGRLARRLSRPDMGAIAAVQASFVESVAVIGGVMVAGASTSASPASEQTPPSAAAQTA